MTDPRIIKAREAAEGSLGRLEAALAGKDTNRTARGPRPTPKAQSSRKRHRVAVRAARKRNR